MLTKLERQVSRRVQSDITTIEHALFKKPGAAERSDYDIFETEPARVTAFCRLQHFVMLKIVPNEYLLYVRKLLLNGGKFLLRV